MNQSSSPLIATSWDVSVAVNQQLRQLHAHWKSLCGNRQMPSRGDFDPINVPKLWPFIFLIDILNAEPRDFRFRLAGTHFRDFAGSEVTGRLISEIFPPDFNAEVSYHWGRCVDNKAPMIGSGKHWLDERGFVNWEGIVLPLSSDGITVNMLLGAAAFSSGR